MPCRLCDLLWLVSVMGGGGEGGGVLWRPPRSFTDVLGQTVSVSRAVANYATRSRAEGHWEGSPAPALLCEGERGPGGEEAPRPNSPAPSLSVAPQPHGALIRPSWNPCPHTCSGPVIGIQPGHHNMHAQAPARVHPGARPWAGACCTMLVHSIAMAACDRRCMKSLGKGSLVGIVGRPDSTVEHTAPHDTYSVPVVSSAKNRDHRLRPA